MVSMALVALGALFAFIAFIEFLPMPGVNLFAGFGSIVVSGFAFGTTWFFRGSDNDYIERGQSVRHWAKAIVISTEIVAGLIIVLWAAVNDPNMLREISSGF